MKTCPTCPKKKTSMYIQEDIASDVKSTKFTSIKVSPIVKSNKKTTL